MLIMHSAFSLHSPFCVCTWRLHLLPIFGKKKKHHSVSKGKKLVTFFKPSFSREVTQVNSTGRTISSPHSRGSTPHQTPPDRFPHLTTPARGCQGSRARDSTPLACPWASTTRSVMLNITSISPFSTPACTHWDWDKHFGTTT